MANQDSEQLSTQAPAVPLPVPLPDHLLGVLGAMVFVFDVRTSRLIYVSPHIEDMLGYTARQILDDPELLRQAVHPDEAPYVLEVLGALLREKVDQRLELRMLSKDERELSVDGVVSVLREDGRPRYVLGVLLDITERKRLEEALRSSRDRMEDARARAYGRAADRERRARERAARGGGGHAREERVPREHEPTTSAPENRSR